MRVGLSAALALLAMAALVHRAAAAPVEVRSPASVVSEAVAPDSASHGEDHDGSHRALPLPGSGGGYNNLF